jgi:hypothetical protein
VKRVLLIVLWLGALAAAGERVIYVRYRERRLPRLRMMLIKKNDKMLDNIDIVC